jgi:hypothetical protein
MYPIKQCGLHGSSRRIASDKSGLDGGCGEMEEHPGKEWRRPVAKDC